MNPVMNQNQMMGGGGASGNNMMESLKSNMMTMLMINNMNGSGSNGNRTGGSGFSMIYMFVATSVVDFLFKNAPFAINFFMKKYNDKIENIKQDLSNVTKDLTDNKVKKKTASITITINVNNPDNVLGHALLDFITNNKNTTHVSYIRESFILNQKDVITIDEEIFARMTESTSMDANGNQGSTSTNVGSGAGSNAGQSAIVQIIEVYSFTKTTDQLRNFLDDIKQKYAINLKNKLGNKRYYFNMNQTNVPMDIDKRKDLSRLPPHFTFIMKHFQTNRKFSNLFGEDIEIIRNRVNFFCKNKKWYDEKGIPYTLGLLLSGAPGTGKTSTIKCLANETNRHICNVNLNTDMTKTQLENLFFNENINVLNPISGQHESFCIPLDQRIYVLEDVDCQSDIVMERALKSNAYTSRLRSETSFPKDTVLRTSTFGPNTKSIKDDGKEDGSSEKIEDKNKVDLSFLLNLLDGVLENPGRIVIMTSNFPDTLDSALIRPGRIDVIAKFGNCTNQTVIEMIEFFYDIILSKENRERICACKEGIITPAELSKVMFEHFSDNQEAVNHMEKLSAGYVPVENNNITSDFLDKMDDQLTNIGCGIRSETEDMPVEIKNTINKIDIVPESNELPFEKIIYEPNTDDFNPFKEEKIKEDTLYVFMNSILTLYASELRIKVKNKNYYKSLLNSKLYFQGPYLAFVQRLIKVFPEVTNLKVTLEELKVSQYSSKNYTEFLEKNKIEPFSLNSISGYTQKIKDFLSKGELDSLRITDILIKDGVIEKPLTLINDGLSFGSSSLNTSEYTAY
jgi:DNA polymerase III delta prime subunit